MAEKAFNLIDESWIPVAGREPVSLKEIFAEESLPTLGGNPRQKIAILKLLLAIAQAASTPRDAEEWAELGSSGMAHAALAYLDRWHDKFYLYGPEPFLQMPVQTAKTLTFDNLQPEIASGNSTRLTHNQCSRSLTDAEKALLLVTEMSMCLSGKKADEKCVLAQGHTKRTGPAGPGTGYAGFLHTFLLGSSIRETIWLNLLTAENIEAMTNFPAGLGRPPWEEMPVTEVCPRALEFQESLQGRLVPLARFCLLDKDGIHYTEGIKPKTHKEGVWDPSVAAQNAGKDYKILWSDPEKRPWRSLSSLLSFISSNSGKGAFECLQLRATIERLEEGNIDEFGVWSGGLKVSDTMGEQKIKSSDDMVESEVSLSREKMYSSLWFDRLSMEMAHLEKLGNLLYACVAGYYAALSAEGDNKKKLSPLAKGEAAKATGLFWESAERLFQPLINACNDKEETLIIHKQFFPLVLECYDQFCSQDTPRQLATWAEHRPGLNRISQTGNAG